MDSKSKWQWAPTLKVQFRVLEMTFPLLLITTNPENTTLSKELMPFTLRSRVSVRSNRGRLELTGLAGLQSGGLGCLTERSRDDGRRHLEFRKNLATPRYSF